ncbi:Bug family tripartite tricarboxylate transporter substrate binding protein [Falsiroseomonas sp. HW251]|uniref:Bug family tripartite tricarboxylate transporter substrate binding protein n=1 Tax=Falsiroseomonas sp. HW251 TaxID=3390998 RepID=UPI003D31B89F
MMKRRAVLGGAASSLAIGSLPRFAAAQAWPTRSIRHVVPFPAGGITDVLARRFCDRLGAQLGRGVLVDNRPGAAGGIGCTAVAQSRPDGYTTLDAGIGTHVFNPMIYRRLAYDPVRDFTPVTLLTRFTPALMVTSDSGFGSVADVIAAVRREPGKVAFGSSGIGSPGHVLVELFGRQIGSEPLHVPFAGGAPAINAMASGAVQALFDFPIAAMPLIEAGRIVPLAILGSQRLSLVPTVPTTRELGIDGLEMSVWRGLFLPANAPRPIVDRLAAEAATVMAMRDIVAHCESSGVTAETSTPEAFAALMEREADRWRPIIRDANITIEG